MTLHVHGLGHFHPEVEITNRFLEELDIGTDDAWIVERVGIRARRSVLPLDYIWETRNRDPRASLDAALYTTAELGARAAELAIARAGISKSDIGMLIAGGSAPDTVSPAEACNVAQALDLEVPAFDVNSACTTFLVQAHLCASMRHGALPSFVLLVVQDSLTKAVDFRDRSSAILFGDAAVAAVVSTQVPGRARVLGTRVASSPAGASKVVVPRFGHFEQDGRAVQMFAIKKSALEFERLRAERAEEDRALHFVGHQVNLRALERICERCGIPPERHHSNGEWYGNTGAPSGASVVSMNWEKWGPEDDVSMVAVGSGLTWGGCLLRFGTERP